MLILQRASLISQVVKNPPAMQETPVRFLGQEDPLEKGQAAHSSIRAWRIPWTVESMGSQKSDTTEVGEGGWLSNLVIFFFPNISQIHLLFTTLTLATLVQNLITSTKIMPVSPNGYCYIRNDTSHSIFHTVSVSIFT